jgi:hypothetical protein
MKMKEKCQPGRTPRGLKSRERVSGKGEDEGFLSGELVGSNVWDYAASQTGF